MSGEILEYFLFKDDHSRKFPMSGEILEYFLFKDDHSRKSYFQNRALTPAAH